MSSSHQNLVFSFIRTFSLLLAGSAVSIATPIPVGVLRFTASLEPRTGLEVNRFSISNLIGDPASSGYGSPPNFPVLTFGGFLDSRLTIVSEKVPQAISLPTIDPGVFDSFCWNSQKPLFFTLLSTV